MRQSTPARHMLVVMFMMSIMAQKAARSKHWPWIDRHGAGVPHWKAVASVDALSNHSVNSVSKNRVTVFTKTIKSSTPSNPVGFAKVTRLARALTQTQPLLHLPEIL